MDHSDCQKIVPTQEKRKGCDKSGRWNQYGEQYQYFCLLGMMNGHYSKYNGAKNKLTSENNAPTGRTRNLILSTHQARDLFPSNST